MHRLFRFGEWRCEKKGAKKNVHGMKEGFQKYEGNLKRKSCLEERPWKSGDVLIPEGQRLGKCTEINAV